MRIRGVSQVSGEHPSHKISRPPIYRLDRNPPQPKPLTIAPDTSIAPHLPYPNAYRIFSWIGRRQWGGFSPWTPRYCIYSGYCFGDELQLKHGVSMERQGLTNTVRIVSPSEPSSSSPIACGQGRIEVRSRQIQASRLRKPLARLTTEGVTDVLSEKGA
jgi:hypothetical protein